MTLPATSSVLVVDDDASIRSLVGEALDMVGYRVLVAADGAEALAVLEREQPCAVLLDMRMPVLDGWGFAREARRRGHCVPIAVMTAADNAQTWCDEVDGAACLAKPFDVGTLFDTIAARFSDRNGGYTRIIKTGRRAGDNAPMVILELVDRVEGGKERKDGAEKKEKAPKAEGGTTAKGGSSFATMRAPDVPQFPEVTVVMRGSKAWMKTAGRWQSLPIPLGQPTGIEQFDFTQYVKDVQVDEDATVGGEPAVKITGVLDTAGLVEGMFGQLGLAAGGAVPNLSDSLGDTRVVIYISEVSHLPLRTLVDLTVEAAGEKVKVHLDYAIVGVNEPVRIPGPRG